MSKHNLIPCPYCGRIPLLEKNPDSDWRVKCVEHPEHPAFAVGDTESEALEGWNDAYGWRMLGANIKNDGADLKSQSLHGIKKIQQPRKPLK